MKLRANFFKLEEDIFLCCAYIPPTNSKYFTEGDQDVLDLLRSDTEKFSEMAHIAIIGDLNCRLGKNQEELNFLEGDDDVFHEVDIPPRKYSDTKSNSSGTSLSNMLNDNTLLTLNGRKVGDTMGKLT